MIDRITELEMKVSFQDQFLEELNGLLTEQQKEIQTLKALVKKMRKQEDEEQNPDIKDISLEVPPPHY